MFVYKSLGDTHSLLLSGAFVSTKRILMFVYKSLGDPRALWHNMTGGVGTSRIARRPPKRDTERSGVACVVLLIYGCIKCVLSIRNSCIDKMLFMIGYILKEDIKKILFTTY